LVLFTLVFLSSCVKDDVAADDEITQEVPLIYTFTDATGNSTVNFSGQHQRLEMLSEMVEKMTSVNTAGTSLDSDQLKNMYANIGFQWNDALNLEMAGSTKQLKNKTAAAANGIPDPAIQAEFELWMDEIGSLSSSTLIGINDGSAGIGGVVQSSTNTSKKYLQDSEGQELMQLIEKGLMGAVFYHQIAIKYLGADEMNRDNTQPVDTDNGKYYTAMEHAWDEAYGYFTSEIDYSVDGNGTDRFWGKYANDREALLGSASSISLAFRKGRLAIGLNDLEMRDTQIDIIRHEFERMIAGTAIHYINGAIADFADDALRNHQLSEAYAFIYSLPYGHMPSVDKTLADSWFDIIGSNFYDVSTEDLLLVRNELASLTQLTSLRDQL